MTIFIKLVEPATPIQFLPLYEYAIVKGVDEPPPTATQSSPFHATAFACVENISPRAVPNQSLPFNE